MNNAKLTLICILLFAYASRLFNLAVPSDFYFDEVYHAFTAQAYAQNDPRGYEWWHQAPEGVAYEWLHPPIAKLFQGLSIYLLGDTSFSWRIPSAIFGTLTIWAVYYLALTLTKKPWLAVLASGIAALDGLLLALSRIAMNDIFVTFFMLLAFSFFWKYLEAIKNKKPTFKLQLISGVFGGLSMATKWSGFFVIGVFWLIQTLIELNTARKQGWSQVGLVVLSLIISPLLWVGMTLKNFKEITSAEGSNMTYFIMVLIGVNLIVAILTFGWQKIIRMALSFVILPLSIYVASYGQFWLQDRPNNIRTFIDLHHQIWWYQTTLDATHPWESRPWQWMLDLKPVWFYVDYQDGMVGNIYALANPIIAWSGLVAVLGLIYASLKYKNWSYAYLVLIYFAVWAPWFASPRIMFFYHYTPAMALLAVALAVGLYPMLIHQKLYPKIFASLVLTTFIVSFIYFYPHLTAIKVNKELAESYFWFESWRP